MLTLVEHKININGNLINYVESGEGVPVIFMHNGGGFWQTWKKQIEYFSKEYKVYGIDWPGFGESSNPDGLISLDLLADTLQEFIEQLGLKKVILIGNCIGGSAALQYASLNPMRVEKLIIFNVCPGKYIYPIKFTRLLFYRLNRFSILKKWVGNIMQFVFLKTFVKRKFPSILFGKHVKQDDFLFQKYVEKFKLDKQTESRVNMVFSVHTFTMADLLKKFKPFPHLLVWGSENKVTPLKKHGYMHRDLLQSEQFEIIHEHGHLCMYEAPEEVNKLITTYLTK